MANSMRFKIGEWSRARKELEKIFGDDLDFKKIFDLTSSKINGYISIEVLYFLSYFEKKGMQENESMEDFVSRTFGERAKNLLISMI